MRIMLFTYGAPSPKWPGSGFDALRLGGALRDCGADAEVVSVIPANVCAPRVERLTDADVPGALVQAPVVPEHVLQRWPGWAGVRGVCAGFNHVVGGALRREVMRFSPNAIVVFGSIPWGTFALRTSAERMIPCVSVEPLTPLLLSLRAGDKAAKYMGTCARSMRAIFAPDRRVQATLLDALDYEGLLLLRPGVDPSPASLRETPRPTRWRSKRLIIAGGDARDAAAQRRALDAYAQASLPETVLVFLGEPSEATRRRARKLDLGDAVEFAPCRDETYIRQCLAWADLFVQAAAPRVGLGLVPLAMGVGTPVVLTGDCPMADDIEQGRHGWVAAAGDTSALVQAIRHAAIAPDLAAVSREAQELIEARFAWRRSAQRLLRSVGFAGSEAHMAMAA